MYSRANCFLPASRFRPKMETRIAFLNHSGWGEDQRKPVPINPALKQKRLQLFEVWRILFFFFFFIFPERRLLCNDHFSSPCWLALRYASAELSDCHCLTSRFGQMVKHSMNHWYDCGHSSRLFAFRTTIYRNVFMQKTLNETTVFKVKFASNTIVNVNLSAPKELFSQFSNLPT